jgi:hypothetical protein
VTAVGGISLSPAGNARGWAETAWSLAGAGCSAFDPKPAWQTASTWQTLTTTGCAKRATADVSAVADPDTGVAVYVTFGGSGWTVYGGTSVAAPIIASVYALAGTPKATDNPASYPYFHGSLFDVTAGSDGDCGTVQCDAATGWDGPTGLGTPNGATAFSVPTTRLGVADFGADQRWRPGDNPRFADDITGDGKADIVGFGTDGVWTAISNGNGTFTTPRLGVAAFGSDQGWRENRFPRLVADVTGDHRADIVGFGDDGVWTATSNGNGTFTTPRLGVANFGYSQGWQVDLHPRLVADFTGDGKADIVGFGNDGVLTAASNGDGTFAAPRLTVAGFGYNQGWRPDKHPRLVTDITGDGRADIVGFGDDQVWTAVANANGTFNTPRIAISDFTYNIGWRVDKHPRLLADITGDHRADIVGFGDPGVWTAVSNGDGTFATPQVGVGNFGYDQGWRVAQHLRSVADITGDGKADIVGTGNDGVLTAVSNGDGTFAAPRLVSDTFGSNQGWSIGLNPQYTADITGDKRADLIGFGNAGVFTTTARGDGTFQ